MAFYSVGKITCTGQNSRMNLDRFISIECVPKFFGTCSVGVNEHSTHMEELLTLASMVQWAWC